MSTNLPWKGLRSYKETDASYFFGRSSEIETLYESVLNNRLTIVYGPSGTGKTSILRAGVFPRLRSQKYFPVYVKLRHNFNEDNEREDVSYLQQIIDTFKKVAGERNYEIEQVIPYTKKDNCQSLWEYFHCNRFWTSDDFPLYPILVLDQFEEIFTLTDARKGKEHVQTFFSQLADLCEDWIPDYIRTHISDNIVDYPVAANYRCIISLREDFLARLEEQTLKYPSFRLNRFSLQPLNEEQALEVITQPIPGLISDNVAGKIIEKVTNRIYKNDFNLHDNPEIDVEPALLSLFCDELNNLRLKRGLSRISEDIIDQFGNNIIRDFYYEAMDEVLKMSNESVVDYLERELLTSDNFRNNISQQDAERHHGVTPEIQKYLIRTKRILRVETWGTGRDKKQENRRLLFTHDVLCDIAKKHRQEREEKREKRKLEEATALAKKAEEKARKLKNRHRITLGLIALLIVGAVCFTLSAYVIEYEECYTQFIKINGWPRGVGEKLSEQQRESVHIYYCLKRKGFLSKGLIDRKERHFTEVEIRNSHGGIETCVTAQPLVPLFSFDEDSVAVISSFKEVCRWSFLSDDEEKYVSKETAYTSDNKVAYVLSYMRGVINKRPTKSDDTRIMKQDVTSTVEGVERNATIVLEDQNGRPISLPGRANRMVISYDSLGREEKMRFYDGDEIPMVNHRLAYGYNLSYDKKNRIETIICCDAFGDEIENVAIRTIRYEYSNNSGVFENNWTKCIYSGTFETENGYNTERREYNGNSISHTYYLNNQKSSNKILECNSYKEVLNGHGEIEEVTYFSDNIDRPYRVVFEYGVKNKACRILSIRSFAKDGKPFIPKEHKIRPYFGLTGQMYKYDEKFDICEEVRLIGNDSVYVYRLENVSDLEQRITHRDDMNDNDNYIEILKYNKQKQLVSRSFISKDGENKNRFIEQDGDSIMCASVTYRYGKTTDQLKNDSIRYEVKTFYDKSGTFCTFPYAKDSCVYGINNNLLRYRVICSSEGEILSSYMLYYTETGILNGQSVLGIEGKPIRCPKWDVNGWSYYKLMTLFDSKGIPTMYKVTNEFGQESYLADSLNLGFRLIYTGDNNDYSKLPIIATDLGAGFMRVETNALVIEKAPIITKKHHIAYLHLTKVEGLNFNSIKDGDILIKLGNWQYDDDIDCSKLKNEWNLLKRGRKKALVLRLTVGAYKVKEIDIPTSAAEWAEYHIINSTEREYNMLFNKK